MVVPRPPAVLTLPLPNPALDAVLANEPKDSVVVRTAGALHTDQPFPGTEEEREAAAATWVLDMLAESDG
jgi:hypothetical protein